MSGNSIITAPSMGAFELVQRTVDGERLQGMVLRCQECPWSILGER